MSNLPDNLKLKESRRTAWALCACSNLWFENGCFVKGFPLGVVLIFFTGCYGDRIWGIYKNSRLQETRFVSLILFRRGFVLACLSQAVVLRIKGLLTFKKSSEKCLVGFFF